MLVLFLACTAGSTPASSTPDADTAPDTGAAERFDVIVVGSGPAGIAAAWAASEAGAEVLLLERADFGGPGLRHAGLLYGAVTPWHEEAGVVDTLAAATADWAGTTGVDPADNGAAAYIAASAATLERAAAHGLPLFPPTPTDNDTINRLHPVAWPPDADRFATLTAGLDAELRLGTEVTGPLLEAGRVVGVTARTAGAAADHELRAGAVILATGGFLRQLDAVAEVRPDLAALDLLFETSPYSEGLALPFLVQVGAGREQPEQIGTYFHSVRDPRFEGAEALVLNHTETFILVGGDGVRFADDTMLGDYSTVAEAPAGDIWLVTGGQVATDLTFSPPGYNLADLAVPETYTVADLAAWGSPDVAQADELTELAELTGLTALPATVDAFNQMAADTTVDAFGRLIEPRAALTGPPWLALRLRAGLAKNFGGVRTDLASRVLTAQGEAVPGLYAAGEVAGMVPGGGSGAGFNGSASACWYGGFVAGETAAAEAPAE